jgi:non-specific serine/threonine protein kinase
MRPASEDRVISLREHAPIAFQCSGLEVDLARREFRAHGVAVPLGSRAFEIVETLVRSAGEVVTKNELLSRVWPGLTVGDNTVEVHISAIRKALGADRKMLKTVSGRGYRLVGNWTERGDTAPDAAPAPLPTVVERTIVTNIPLAASALIGREAAVQQLCDMMSAYRVVTLVGPGGIGKTVLASEVARRLLPTVDSDVMFIELVSLSDPDLVPSAIAYALDLKLPGNDTSAAAVARAIGNKKILLVLDNCEHLIDAAAATTETLIRLCPLVAVLATSREVLRVEGEYVYRVPALEVPDGDPTGAADLLEHSAVQLFVARTRVQQADFKVADAEIPNVAAICRHLDGMPLAIEFAAARSVTLGIGEVERHLDDRFSLLSGGRRTALPRHQTLRATLDWSYELLPEEERRLLRQLAAFPAGFTWEAAAAVADEAKSTVASLTSNLVSKSLVTLDSGEGDRRWRLLETVRVYAMEKLVGAGEQREARRRHAEFYTDKFRPFGAEDRLQAALDEIALYKREVDNLRAALSWAFSSDGDAAMGVELATIAADFWIAVSLVSDAREWAIAALEKIGDAAGSRSEMVLKCSLGFATLYAEGPTVKAREAMTEVLALARRFGDVDFQQRAIFGLFLFASRSSALSEVLSLARDFEETSRTHDLKSQLIAAWVGGIAQTYTAAHLEASARLEWAIERYPIHDRRRDIVRFGGDLRASALSHNTVNLLSRGLLDTASRSAHQAVEEARGANHPAVLGVALAWAAGFVFVNIGELDTAEALARELIDHAHRHALRPYHAVAVAVRASIAAERGAAATGIDDLRRSLAEMRQANYLLFYPLFRTRLATIMEAVGRLDDGVAEIDDALELALNVGYAWAVPEILRVKGELLQRRNPGDLAAGEMLFRRAIGQANAQGALYWELSSATSLAALLHRQGKTREARDILKPLYARLTEGRESPRARRAGALLAELDA